MVDSPHHPEEEVIFALGEAGVVDPEEAEKKTKKTAKKTIIKKTKDTEVEPDVETSEVEATAETPEVEVPAETAETEPVGATVEAETDKTEPVEE